MKESQETARKIGIVGASGRLGRLIALEAVQAGFNVRELSTRRHENPMTESSRSDRAPSIGVLSVESLAELEAVIIAAPQTSNALHSCALEAGCHVVDVGISETVIRSALALDGVAGQHERTLMLMAGLAPGLTGMLGDAMTRACPSAKTIDVVLLQNSRGTAGKRGVSEMLDMLSDVDEAPMVRLSHDMLQTEGKTGPFMFALPTPERKLLPPATEGPTINYYTLFDKPSMNRTIRLLRLIRRASERGYRSIRNVVATAKSKQASPAEETICLTAVASGDDGAILAREDLTFESDYGATAKLAVTFANMAVSGLLASGAGHPAKFADWREVTARAFSTSEMIAKS